MEERVSRETRCVSGDTENATALIDLECSETATTGAEALSTLNAYAALKGRSSTVALELFSSI